MSQDERGDRTQASRLGSPLTSNTFRAILHPEIEFFPFETDYTPSYGIAGAMRIRDGWVDAWERMDADLEELVAEGDDVVASIHVMGRGKTSGVEVDTRLHLHFKIRDSRIVYVFEHTERARALKAAGVSERDVHADS